VLLPPGIMVDRRRARSQKEATRSQADVTSYSSCFDIGVLSHRDFASMISAVRVADVETRRRFEL